jgi:hypothetical protein
MAGEAGVRGVAGRRDYAAAINHIEKAATPEEREIAEAREVSLLGIRGRGVGAK